VSDYADDGVRSLAELPARKLEAAAVVLGSRKDGLWLFHRVFEEVAAACRSGKEVRYTEAHHRFAKAVARMDDEDVERLGNATLPFWHYVIEAAHAKREEGED
jgi:hypothetical protein